MKILGGVFAIVLLGIVSGSDDDHYEVPEPIFDVYSPKGLQISLPDSSDVTTVEFFLSLPDCPQPLFREVNHTDGNHWVYWNPDIILRMHDKLRYKLMIQRKGLYWKKEGVHVVQKVTNITDCAENQGQKVISGFSGLGGVEDRNKGMLTTGKSSNYKSSYSTYKNSELKPITKSSMSTTSGTFYIKPSGVMEATGYKKGSSFDSTKREGEQWEHYQSELTAEELENMKNMYGSGFHDFQRFHGSLFPSLGSGGAKMYEKSYMSSESQSFPTLHGIRYGESQPLTTTKFHETHKTHETSSFSHSKPVFQFSDSTGGGSYVESGKSEKHYRMEPFTGLPNPLPPQGTLFKATEYVREEHTVPVGQVSHGQVSHGQVSHGQVSHGQVSHGQVSQVNVDRESHSSPQKIIQVSQTGEFSSHNQEIVKPTFPQIEQRSSGRADQMEYTSGNLQTVERQDYSSRVYLGNIFTSVKTSKVKSPQECSLVPGLDYTSTGNVRELEKKLYELSCLATLAESTMKEELALLKQRNNDLNRKLEQLEHEVNRISSTCNCYE